VTVESHVLQIELFLFFVLVDESGFQLTFAAGTEAFYFDLLGSTMYVGELANRLPVRDITPLTPRYRNITMDQVLVESCKELILLKGIPESPIENLTITHLEATARERDLKVQDVLGLIMSNCVIK